MSSDGQVNDKKLLDPQDALINVSNKRDAKSYYTISKLILRKFGNVELNALGSAAGNTVRLADFLVRNKLAKIDKINSEVRQVEDSKGQGGPKAEVAFSVKLSKTAEFDDLTKDLK